ncbi:TonB-dependent hemoglobin/transferrin/lactoferrin family receptor [Lampropedia aestuarii]|uniref:TonB-dependent hemoglobin/transferrin/lactoferrin family receptor n=1 Tax=Lampropedia aestuarii TaxID=2562762 RepID=A0A4S5BUE6_9BURK|nr:TonB-dependent hemoglobin/transferrin/lactoferrin family receptor [Lampropedia aestuarii]THJ33466.1 TonB-dependent hemoglobin/transferrin/lactoferrin family receptor [Lampropedia aestuarii]
MARAFEFFSEASLSRSHTDTPPFSLRPVAMLMAGMALSSAVLAQTTATATLPEVHVEAVQEEPAQGRSTELSAEDLNRQGTRSMADVVRNQPLVSAPTIASGSGNLWDGAGTSSYNIRGLDGNRVAIEVDGVALPPVENRPDNNSNNSYANSRETLEPELYSLVRIESGPTAAGQGGASGSAGRVRFATKSPEEFLTGHTTTYGSYKGGYLSSDKSRMHVLTGAAKIGEIQALGMYVRRDGEQQKSRGDVPPNDKDWSSNAVLAKFVWGSQTNNRLGLTIEHFDRDTELSNANKITASLPRSPRQDANDRRTRISLDNRFEASDIAAFDVLNTRVYYQQAQAKNDTYVPQTVSLGVPISRSLYTNSKNDSWGVQLDASKRLDGQHLAYGLNLSSTDSKRPWEEVRTNLNTGAESLTVKDRAASAKTSQASLYVRDTLSFELGGRKATITPGVTLQHSRIAPKDAGRYAEGSPAAAGEVHKQSSTNLLPSLGLSLELQPGFEAYGQYSRAVRQPASSELTGSFENPGTGYAVLGNPDLKEEKSDNFELGVRGALVPGVQLDASVFYNRYSNYIEYTNLGVDPNLPQFGLFVYRTENLGKVNIWGSELATRFELGEWMPSVQGLSATLAGGWSQGTTRNTRTGQKSWLPSALPAKVVGGVAFDDPGERYGLGLNVTWVRAKQAPTSDALTGNNTERFKVPSATTLDLAGYWNINKHVTWRAGIYNLTNRKYWDYASVNGLAANASNDIQRQAQPGRAFGTSLEVRF